MVVMLRQCCCGCTLKTGSIILGVLNAIAGGANLIIGIVATAAGNISNNEAGDLLVGVGAAMAVFGALMLAVSICLIVGACKDNPVLLIPWMVYTVLYLIAITILYIINAAENFDLGYTAQGAGNIVGAIIYILLETYFLLVVYSLYRELKGTAPQNNV